MFIATSPRPARSTSADAQGNVEEVFFPIWSLQEVKRLLKERKEGDLTPQEVAEIEIRFVYFGGVPRWIARPDTSHDRMMRLGMYKTHNAIASVSSATLPEMFNPRSTDPSASGLLIHIKVDDNFGNAGKKFASAMVEVELNRRFYDAEKTALRVFLAAAKDIEGFKQTAGILFESWWHVVLQRGVEVQLQEMFDRKSIKEEYPPNSAPRNIELPQTASRYSARQNLDDVHNLLPDKATGELGTYLRFLVPNVPSVDALSVVDLTIADSIFGADSTLMTREEEEVASRRKKRKGNSSVGTEAQTTTKTKAPWCMIAYRHAISGKEKLSPEGITRVMDLSMHACGDVPASVHFVVVTTASHADQYHLFKVEAEKRFTQVRQWLLILPDDWLVRLTSAFRS
jgi:hypothetical protein